ncbi:Vacuolar segregation protein 7 [Fusarium oxysporum f. sp. albedinis]|nr:Vacuolar segregation protein 7 [Fusarium oxysporum f. sp. albedinis]
MSLIITPAGFVNTVPSSPAVYGSPECCSTRYGVLYCTIQGCLVLLGTITGLDLKRDSPLQGRFALDYATLDHHFYHHEHHPANLSPIP